MKRQLIIEVLYSFAIIAILLLAAIGIKAQSLAELSIAGTTRLNGMIIADAGYRSGNVAFGGTFGYETGAKLPSYGGWSEYRFPVGYYDDEYLELKVGAAYTKNCGTLGSPRTLEGQSQWTGIAAIAYRSGNVSWLMRYQGGTINIGAGYRFGK